MLASLVVSNGYAWATLVPILHCFGRLVHSERSARGLSARSPPHELTRHSISCEKLELVDSVRVYYSVALTGRIRPSNHTPQVTELSQFKLDNGLAP